MIEENDPVPPELVEVMLGIAAEGAAELRHHMPGIDDAVIGALVPGLVLHRAMEMLAGIRPCPVPLETRLDVQWFAYAAWHTMDSATDEGQPLQVKGDAMMQAVLQSPSANERTIATVVGIGVAE